MPRRAVARRRHGSGDDGRGRADCRGRCASARSLENLGRDPAAAYYADLAFLKPADARALMGLAPDRDPTTSPVYQAVTEPYRRCRSTDAVQRAEYADLKVYCRTIRS